MIIYFNFTRMKFKKVNFVMLNDKILSLLSNNRMFQNNENKFPSS